MYGPTIRRRANGSTRPTSSPPPRSLRLHSITRSSMFASFRSRSIHQHDFGIFQTDDVDALDVGDRRTVACVDADTVNLDGAGGRHKVGMPGRIHRHTD